MAGKTDFTEDEWTTLHRGLTGAGMLVSISERGFSSTFKETGAMASFLAHHSQEANSQFARELSGVHGSGWKVTSSPDELKHGALEALRTSIEILTAKDPEDLADYRELVIDLATAVAKAAPGGDDAEESAIDDIREALGV